MKGNQHQNVLTTNQTPIHIMARLLVLYDSTDGHVETMAHSIAGTVPR